MHPERAKSKKKMPSKSFLIVEEQDFPHVFRSSVLCASNRRLGKTDEFQLDEDFDSDRETIKSHQKRALKALEEQITKFQARDTSL